MAKLIWQAEVVHFNCPGAVECSLNEGSGDAGTSQCEISLYLLPGVDRCRVGSHFAAERTCVLALLS